jgi:hypothetical protein
MLSIYCFAFVLAVYSTPALGNFQGQQGFQGRGKQGQQGFQEQGDQGFVPLPGGKIQQPQTFQQGGRVPQGQFVPVNQQSSLFTNQGFQKTGQAQGSGAAAGQAGTAGLGTASSENLAEQEATKEATRAKAASLNRAQGQGPQTSGAAQAQGQVQGAEQGFKTQFGQQGLRTGGRVRRDASLTLPEQGAQPKKADLTQPQVQGRVTSDGIEDLGQKTPGLVKPQAGQQNPGVRVTRAVESDFAEQEGLEEGKAREERDFLGRDQLLGGSLLGLRGLGLRGRQDLMPSGLQDDEKTLFQQLFMKPDVKLYWIRIFPNQDILVSEDQLSSLKTQVSDILAVIPKKPEVKITQIIVPSRGRVLGVPRRPIGGVNAATPIPEDTQNVTETTPAVEEATTTIPNSQNVVA